MTCLLKTSHNSVIFVRMFCIIILKMFVNAYDYCWTLKSRRFWHNQLLHPGILLNLINFKCVLPLANISHCHFLWFFSLADYFKFLDKRYKNPSVCINIESSPTEKEGRKKERKVLQRNTYIVKTLHLFYICKWNFTYFASVQISTGIKIFFFMLNIVTFAQLCIVNFCIYEK